MNFWWKKFKFWWKSSNFRFWWFLKFPAFLLKVNFLVKKSIKSPYFTFSLSNKLKIQNFPNKIRIFPLTHSFYFTTSSFQLNSLYYMIIVDGGMNNDEPLAYCLTNANFPFLFIFNRPFPALFHALNTEQCVWGKN